MVFCFYGKQHVLKPQTQNACVSVGFRNVRPGLFAITTNHYYNILHGITRINAGNKQEGAYRSLHYESMIHMGMNSKRIIIIVP